MVVAHEDPVREKDTASTLMPLLPVPKQVTAVHDIKGAVEHDRVSEMLNNRDHGSFFFQVPGVSES